MIHIAGVNEKTKNLGWFLNRELTGSRMVTNPGNWFETLNPKNQSFVCCIGKLSVQSLQELNIQDLIESNLVSPINWVRNFMDAFPNAKKRIILISSMAYKKALNGHSVYGAAKAGLVAFARHLAYETAAGGLLKIWTIAPGTIAYTPAYEKLLKDTVGMKGKTRDQIIEDVQKSFPDGKLISKGSVLDVVKFCLSGKADQMSGHCFEIANCQR